MDKVHRSVGALSDIPVLAEELVGISGHSFHLRCVHYQEDTLDLVEKVEEQDRSFCDELGRCHCVCRRGRLFRESLLLPELCHPYLFVGKIIVGGRLPVCEQDELWGTYSADSASSSHDPTYHSGTELQVVSGLEYKRVKALGEVQLNDIVVFNFPAGDTVAVNVPAEDIYRLSYQAGKELTNPIDFSKLDAAQQRIVYDHYYQVGRKYLNENKAMYGEIVARPVDRRENYVKRCVGQHYITRFVCHNRNRYRTKFSTRKSMSKHL